MYCTGSCCAHIFTMMDGVVSTMIIYSTYFVGMEMVYTKYKISYYYDSYQVLFIVCECVCVCVCLCACVCLCECVCASVWINNYNKKKRGMLNYKYNQVK